VGEGAIRVKYKQNSSTIPMKTRQEIITKIQSILKLQSGTTFEGEASAAANLIDKLCKQYGLSVDEVGKVQVLDESFYTYKRVNAAHNTLLNAVARFYDGAAYIKNGDVKSLQVIGSEGQQIQIRLYFEYLLGVMEKECNAAYEAEKFLSELTGGSVSRSFKINFRKAFAEMVSSRLKEMKIEENRIHDDAKAVKDKVALMRFSRAKATTGANGAGAFAGAGVGSSVSLNRQASGSTRRALCGV
jgi:hypothetical protein